MTKKRKTRQANGVEPQAISQILYFGNELELSRFKLERELKARLPQLSPEQTHLAVHNGIYHTRFLRHCFDKGTEMVQLVSKRFL